MWQHNFIRLRSIGLDIIKKIPKIKSPGHDLITNAILKNIPRKAITYLTILFNSLIKIGYFSKEWKLALLYNS